MASISFCSKKKKNKLMSKILVPLTYTGSIELWSHIIKSTEIFIEAHDNYQKQTQRNRLYIHGSNGKLMLSIPVKHKGEIGHQKYRNVEIDNSSNWRLNHLKSIQIAYRSSPYFEFYEEIFLEIFSTNCSNLFDFNKTIFNKILELLDITTSISFSKVYQPNPFFDDLRKLCEIKKNQNKFELNYNQVFIQKNGFINNLSIIDLLFNVGPNSKSILKKIKL